MDQEPAVNPPFTPQRPGVTGRYTRQALVVAAESAQPQVKSVLAKLEFECEVFEDPYWAMLELLKRPMVFRAVVLSLQGLYREELAMVRTLRTRMPRLDVFVTHIEGREASLAEAMKLGVTGIVAEDGLHRLQDLEPATSPASAPAMISPAMTSPAEPAVMHEVRPAPASTTPINPTTTHAGIEHMNDDYALPSEAVKASSKFVEVSDPVQVFAPAVAPSKSSAAETPEPVLSADEIRALLSDGT